MLDIRWIRENPEALNAALASRGAAPVSRDILAIDEKLRKIMTELQTAQSRRNEVSKLVGAAKQKGEDATPLFEEMKKIGPAIKMMEEEEGTLQNQLQDMLARLPNIPAADVPVGKSEDENVEVRKWGEKPRFNFEPKPHFELGEATGSMNFNMGAKLAGSRFVWMQGDLARLERALGNFMIDTHTREHGYLEVAPPFMVNEATAYGTGQLPKFGEDLFKTTNGYWLIPTAEVPLTNYVNDTILPVEQLPLKFTAMTPCFRSEAGAAGKDTRGYIRMHQFTKVEMVQVVHPDKSDEALEEMTACAEKILQKLGLSYRVVKLCTGDIGPASRRTYDLEVWVPSQQRYREISSCSNCGDFQARRMKARYRVGEGKTAFVHTLNGSGVATGRALVAVMENYQQADGSIAVPEVLQPYMGGQKVIAGPQQ